MPRYKAGQIGIPRVRVDILHVTMYVDLDLVRHLRVLPPAASASANKMPIHVMTRHFCVTTKPFSLGNFVSDLKSTQHAILKSPDTDMKKMPTRHNR